VAKNPRYASCCWQGLQPHPKISEVLDVYGQGLESVAYGHESVPLAMASAQGDAARRLHEA
jgi:hypothetical protein